MSNVLPALFSIISDDAHVHWGYWGCPDAWIFVNFWLDCRTCGAESNCLLDRTMFWATFSRHRGEFGEMLGKRVGYRAICAALTIITAVFFNYFSTHRNFNFKIFRRALRAPNLQLLTAVLEFLAVFRFRLESNFFVFRTFTKFLWKYFWNECFSELPSENFHYVVKKKITDRHDPRSAAAVAKVHGMVS